MTIAMNTQEHERQSDEINKFIITEKHLNSSTGTATRQSLTDSNNLNIVS